MVGEGGRPIVKIRNMLSEKTDPLRFEFESRKETILHLLREIRATLLEKSAVGRPSASACLLPILMPMLPHGRRHDISNVHLRKRIPVLSASTTGGRRRCTKNSWASKRGASASHKYKQFFWQLCSTRTDQACTISLRIPLLEGKCIEGAEGRPLFAVIFRKQ